MNTILRTENLSYKDILNDVSFEIAKNSFNVLIGPNSCGKTTLVKCLGGLLECSGSIFFNNCIISTDNVCNMKEFGLVIDLPFILNGSVMDNLMYPLLNLGYSEYDAKKKIYSTSDKLDVGYILMKNVNDLKSAEKKILCFLRGIIHEPKIIIIDDLFDSLNSFYKKKIFSYLKKLKNRTILFMSSNEEYILYANEDNDTVIIMNKGKIVEQASLKDIIIDDKKFVKNGIKLPFIVDLSHKLKSYDLLEDITLEIDEMVNKIWE